MKRSRLENWANWAFDNWHLVLIPLLVVMLGFIIYMEATNDDPLRDRATRTRIFDELVAEMKGIETPPQKRDKQGGGSSQSFIDTDQDTLSNRARCRRICEPDGCEPA
jgi:hypothetical protein